MSVLIKGMEMPQNIGEAIIITRDGKASRIRAGRIIIEGSTEETNVAIELPSHGRLIDADELFTEMAKRKSYGELTAKSALRAVSNAPTIIEAEENGNE